MMDVKVLVRCFNQEQYLFDCIRRLRGHKYEILADYPKLGKCARLNEAIQRCETEWVAFNDADDMSLENRFKWYALDFVYSDCYVLKNNKLSYYSAGRFDRERLKQNNFIPFSTIMIKTEIAKQIPFDFHLNGKFEDWVWLNKVAKVIPFTRIAYHPAPTIVYRDNSHPYGRIPIVRKIRRIYEMNKVRRMIETLSD